jgi:hypothetical protein
VQVVDDQHLHLPPRRRLEEPGHTIKEAKPRLL